MPTPAGREIVLRGGWVVDGTGAPPVRADVAIAGERISAVGRASAAPTADVVDVTGKYLFPGLIDTHIHADALAADEDVSLGALRQGVTTLILGQDGLSFAPGSATTISAISRYFGAVNGPCPAPLTDGCTVADLLAHYDRATAVNVAYAAPAGTIRAEVMGYDDSPADRAQLSHMRRLVERALDHGAVGLSTGLEYTPGCYADAVEIAELCGPVAEVGAIHLSHMRAHEADAWRGLGEVFDISRISGVAAHISHLHGPAHMITALLADARGDDPAGGLDVTFDSYPYLKGSSILAMVALPKELQAGGPGRMLDRLADPAVRRRLARDWFPAIRDVLPRVTLAHLAADEWRWAEGLTLSAAAERCGLDPAELVCELLVATDLGAGCVFGQPPTNTDADMRALLRHEAQMVGSDGIMLGSAPHPRAWGAFARALRRHVRELGDWTWGEAALHLAGHPARRFGLRDRGLLRQGCIADIAVVDPAAVADRATYAEPRRPATGVDTVLVSGRMVLHGGSLTGVHAGRALRRGSA